MKKSLGEISVDLQTEVEQMSALEHITELHLLTEIENNREIDLLTDPTIGEMSCYNP